MWGTTPEVKNTPTRSVTSLAGFQEAHAQGAFGMDGTADASAASGMMGMSGYNPGQGAAFVSAGTKASGELLWPSSSCRKASHCARQMHTRQRLHVYVRRLSLTAETA